MFWTGGTHGYGHVAISDGSGSVWSTDLPVEAHVGLVPEHSVVQSWPNHQLAGWSTMLEGYGLDVGR